MTDFYVYVRDKYFCVLVPKEKKEARENPCGLPNTDTDFCEYVRSTDFRAYLKEEGR